MKQWLRSPDLAAVILRLALGAIFVAHGCLKLIYFDGGKSWFPDTAILPAEMQVAVAYAELACGVALLLGLLTRLAALGTVGIMIGALYFVTWRLDFATGQQIDPNYAEKLQVGNEYNYALIAMGVGLTILGAGAVSVDRLLFRHAPHAAPVAPRRESVGAGV